MSNSTSPQYSADTRVNREAIVREIRQTIRDYVQRTPLESLRAYCKTAEEWRDGADSMMTKLHRQHGQLACEGEYRSLAREAEEALSECVLPDEREPLVALTNWARNIAATEKALAEISGLACNLVSGGVYGEEVSAVVQHAVRIAAEFSSSSSPNQE